jgi:hypothetical protein
VRNAKALAGGNGTPEARSSLARRTDRDHLWRLTALTCLQLLV